MQLEISHTPAHEHNIPYPEYSDRHQVAQAVDAFRAHMDSTGKICPRPWCWRRFFVLFQPAHEPPWLSSWWSTSAEEKKALFLAQLEYLARHTDRFPAACRFLHGLDNENWLKRLKGPE